eukprot:Rmarinus@m.19935
MSKTPKSTSTVDVRLNKYTKPCDSCTLSIATEDVYISSSRKYFHIECAPAGLMPSLRALKLAKGVREFPNKHITRLVFSSTHVALTSLQHHAINADLQWNSEVLMQKAMKEDDNSVIPLLEKFVSVFSESECVNWLLTQLVESDKIEAAEHDSASEEEEEADATPVPVNESPRKAAARRKKMEEAEAAPVTGLFAPRQKFKCGNNYIASLILTLPEVASSIQDWTWIVDHLGNAALNHTARRYIGNVIKAIVIHKKDSTETKEVCLRLLRHLGDSSESARDLLALLQGRTKDVEFEEDLDDDLREGDILYRQGLPEPLIEDPELTRTVVLRLLDVMKAKLQQAGNHCDVADMRVLKQSLFVLKTIFEECLTVRPEELRVISLSSDVRSRISLANELSEELQEFLQCLVEDMASLRPTQENLLLDDIDNPKVPEPLTSIFAASATILMDCIVMLRGIATTNATPGSPPADLHQPSNRTLSLPAAFWKMTSSMVNWRPHFQRPSADHFKTAELISFMLVPQDGLDVVLPIQEAVPYLHQTFSSLAKVIIACPLCDILRVSILKSLNALSDAALSLTFRRSPKSPSLKYPSALLDHCQTIFGPTGEVDDESLFGQIYYALSVFEKEGGFEGYRRATVLLPFFEWQQQHSTGLSSSVASAEQAIHVIEELRTSLPGGPARVFKEKVFGSQMEGWVERMSDDEVEAPGIGQSRLKAMEVHQDSPYLLRSRSKLSPSAAGDDGPKRQDSPYWTKSMERAGMDFPGDESADDVPIIARKLFS